MGFGFEYELTAIGHGVSCIHSEVDENLQELCGVNVYRVNFPQAHHNLDVLTNQGQQG